MLKRPIATLLEQAAGRVLAERGQADAALPPVEVERAREPAHGDLASSLALGLARLAGEPPMQLAEAIADALPAHPALADVRPAMPGFLNIRLNDAWLGEQLSTMLREGLALARPGGGKPADLTFLAAPPGPLQAVHARQAVWGSTLAALLRAVGDTVRLTYSEGRSWQRLSEGDRRAGLAAQARVLSALGLPVAEWRRAIEPAWQEGAWRLEGLTPEPREVVMAATHWRSGGPQPTFEQAVEAFGWQALRFHLLTRPADHPLRLDWELAGCETAENPAFWVAYTAGRTRSLLRVAEREGLVIDPAALTCRTLRLAEPERELLLHVLAYPDEVVGAATALAPHRLVRTAQELSGAFQRFYAECRLFGQPQEVAAVRLALIRGADLALGHALALMDARDP